MTNTSTKRPGDEAAPGTLAAPVKTIVTEEGAVKRGAEGAAMGEDEDDGMGEFEDAFEDDLSSSDDDGDIIIHNGDTDDEDAKMEVDDEEEGETVPESVYIPGQHALGKDEQLEHDATAYHMLHTLSMHWPCLSFDVLRDELGSDRLRFPHSMYLVAGTQADRPKNNELVVMKLSQLNRTSQDADDSDEDENDADDDQLDDDPVLEHRSIKHNGGVNRVRVYQPATSPEVRIAATWSDTGKVHLWDVAGHYASLSTPGKQAPRDTQALYTVNGHREEGFAMDWSPHAAAPGLLSGCCNGQIILTKPRDSSLAAWTQDDAAFHGHQGSVEDLQWSPSERTVFASCGVDGTVRIWDTRQKRTRSALAWAAHPQTDVNVISWNQKVAYLMASGADNGVFSVWDMRALMSAPAISGQNASVAATGKLVTTPPVATFDWHKAPITSLHWNPTDESSLAVASADDQVTLWDLAVEADPEEERMHALDGSVQVPPQLLFIHQGCKDVKEVRWHAQIPGAVVASGGSGFDVFKTISA